MPSLETIRFITSFEMRVSHSKVCFVEIVMPNLERVMDSILGCSYQKF